MDALNRLSSLPRCKGCGWRKPRKALEITSKRGRARWRGVQRCGSIHACPDCSATIRYGRSLEISSAAAEWIAAGNEVYMITFTCPHDLGMALDKLITVIAAGFSTMLSGGAWYGRPAVHIPARMGKRGRMLPAKNYPAKPGMRETLGVAGTIRSLEVTYGQVNGWHPHLHVLVFVAPDPAAPFGVELAALTKYFGDRWSNFIVAQGYREPTHGVHVEKCYHGEGAAEYICKTQEGKSPGNEMARGDLKTARSGHWVPYQLLQMAADGDEKALGLWHDYESATFRHQVITWSPGLREMVRKAAPDRVVAEEDWLVELTNDEVVAAASKDDDEDADLVARVDEGADAQIRSIPGFRVSILEAYEDNGFDGLVAYAEGCGFSVSPGQVPLIVVPDREDEDHHVSPRRGLATDLRLIVAGSVRQWVMARDWAAAVRRIALEAGEGG